MNTRRISDQAITAIDQYLHFRFHSAECNIPYFNNRRTGLRAALPVLVGKGSPKQIYEEIEIIATQERVPFKDFTDQSLKHFLISHNIGIDCSGLAYFILNEESVARGKGSLDRHISFVYSKGIVSKIASRLHPVKNVDAKTFAHDKNSTIVAIKDIQPGDIITMVGSDISGNEFMGERDHILVIHQIEYQNFLPVTLHYINSIAWSSDGMTGHGVREGKIDIADINKPITDQIWTENNATGNSHFTHVRAKKSLTEVRRLRYF